MIKALLLFITITFTVFSFVNAQPPPTQANQPSQQQAAKAIDSIKLVLAKYKAKANFEADTNYLNSLNREGFYFIFLDRDTAFALGQKAKLLCEKVRYEKGQIDALINMARGRLRPLDKVIPYLTEALVLAEMNNDQKRKAEVYKNIGSVNISNRQPDAAVEPRLNALKIYQSLNNPQDIIYANIDVSIAYTRAKKYSLANDHGLIALRLSQSARNKYLQIACLNNLSNVYAAQNKVIEQLDYHNKALKIYESLNDQKGQAVQFNRISIDYLLLGNFASSLENEFNSLKINEALNDIQAMGYNCNSIGIIYGTSKKYDESTEYFKKALELKGGQNATPGDIAIASRNIAENYLNQKKYPEALDYLNKAKQIFEHVTDDWIGTIQCMESIAQIYQEQKKYAEALEVKQAAIKKQVELDGKPWYWTYTQLASIFCDLKQYDSALYYARMALSLTPATNKVRLADIHETFTKIYKAKGDGMNALFHYEQYKLYTDSLINQEAEKKTAYLAAGYEYSKKETELKAQQAIEVAELNNRNLEAIAEQAEMKRLTEITRLEQQNDNLRLQQEKEQSELRRKLETQELLKKNEQTELQGKLEKQSLQQENEKAESKSKLRLYTLLAALAVFSLIAFILIRNNRQKQKANDLLNRQKTEIDLQREVLEKTLRDLKSTQSQLIQSEKMASLGELTAGIAHEIQNPLNFVNNFSEINTELIEELKAELTTGNHQQVTELLDNIKENEQKINHHGKRADAIVKGMLQHSRKSIGVKEPTDINALADEYLRLAYHGLRAKDKSFNATMITDFDKNLSAGEAGAGKINIISQDIGRVILNLITNAFYAVTEKKKQAGDDYEPTVTVSTKKFNSGVEVRVRDNGNGIPKKVLEKIFQPFFTTKPTGEGTGLGLSISYDIIKAHGGEMKVETKENEGTDFIILLPI